MLHDSDYLQRFGFIPSPQTINTDDATLRRFGYANVYDKTKPVPARLWIAGQLGAQAENVDGLPVGFARMTGVRRSRDRPARRGPDRPDLRRLPHRPDPLQGHRHPLRRRPGDDRPQKLEITTGLSIAYTLLVPGRFTRFADRVLGPSASDADRDALKQKLSAIGTFLIDWETTYARPSTARRGSTRRRSGTSSSRTPRKDTAASTRSTASAIRSSPRT